MACAQLLPAVTAIIPISQIKDFQSYPSNVKKLINNAYNLSQKKLTYLYGSSDPANKGMDCSGTIYYLLKSVSITEVPRDANGMFVWAKTKGRLHLTNSNNYSKEFSELKPGDLLFWSGTYHTHELNSISHVMIYLGKNNNGKPLMFGSSDGRTYQGKKMWGVSVFDFNLPSKNSHAKFIGYSCIPHFTCK
ncbi:MAG: DUF1175 family protein [Gammaproteobacteria bacterium]|nr:DUF1175 family protein [Gammaproteobacteria bacterium]